MYWRQMFAWMLYVVQTSFSGQATSTHPVLNPTAPHHHLCHHPSPSRHPHAPPSWCLYLARVKLEHVAGSSQTGVNQYKKLSQHLYICQPSPESTAVLPTRGLCVCVCHAIRALLLCRATGISGKLHPKSGGGHVWKCGVERLKKSYCKS